MVVWNSQQCRSDEFKPVLSLYATKISSRYLKIGDRVGYGGVYTAQKMCKVSNYDFGYGSGFCAPLHPHIKLQTVLK